MSPESQLNQWQREALAGFREQQEAYLEAIAAWRNAFSGAATAGAAPTPPSAPTMDAGLGSNAVVDANRVFMEAVIKQQQEFLEKMTRALGSNG
jgi:hypothetical protein